MLEKHYHCRIFIAAALAAAAACSQGHLLVSVAIELRRGEKR